MSGSIRATAPAPEAPRASSPVNRPDVAVIMSVHASVPLEFLKLALESVLRQTYPNVHPFVVCDGPVGRDVAEYLGGFPPGTLRLIHFERNRGLPSALNAMLDVVIQENRFEFVARMDADDVSEPERFERQVEFMLTHPDVGLVGTWCTEIDEAGQELFVKKLPTSHAEMIRFMAVRSPLVHPSVLARTSIFAGGIRYDPTLRQAQDYDLWSRLAAAGVRMANVPDPLLRFRVDRNFYTRRTGRERAFREARMKYEHLVRFRLRSPRNLALLGGLLLLRLAPTWVKKLAYRTLR